VTSDAASQDAASFAAGDAGDAGSAIDAPSAPDAAPAGDAGDYYVQGAMAEWTGTTRAVAVTFTHPLAAHNTLLLAVHTDNSLDIASVVSALGNTYSPLVGPAVSDDNLSTLYVAYDCRAGAETVTVTLAGDPTDFGVLVHEYTGLAPNSFDASASGAGTNKTKDGIVEAVMTTAADDLVFGFGFAYDANNDGTLIAGSNATLRQSGSGVMTEDLVAGPPGFAGPTATMTGGTNWVFLNAAFKTH
jgi:hypothetical protein